jgi:O-acetyl-ADP-ribose deacetylase (regulator of RNase III)
MFKHMRSGWNLGDVQYVSAFEYKTSPLIANMATQETYGHEDKVYIDYDAVQMCLDSLLSYAASLGYSVALPKIGCDLANGDWKTVEGILRDVSAWHPTVDVSVYYLENERAMNEIYV